MEKELMEVFNQNGIVTYTFMSMFIGCLFCFIYDFISSLSNYLLNKTWITKDYEKIIYKLFNSEKLTHDEEEIMIKACISYRKIKMKEIKRNNKRKKKSFKNKNLEV